MKNNLIMPTVTLPVSLQSGRPVPVQTQVEVERNVTVDILKSIAIFGVVYIHSSGFIKDSAVAAIASSFRFCVPVFIAIWAYFFEISCIKLKNNNAKIRSSLTRLAIPFVIWSAMYFLLLADFNELTLQKALTMYWSGYGWSGQYFFIILFQLICAYPLIRWIFNCSPVRYGIVVLIVFLYIAQAYFPDMFSASWFKLGDRFFIYWIPYVFLGIYLARNRHYFAPAITCWVLLLIPFETIFLRNIKINFSAYVMPSVLIGSTFLISSVLNRKLPEWLVFNSARKLFHLVGSNTMGIFVMNPLVIMVCSKILKRTDINLIFGSAVSAVAVSFFINFCILTICLFITGILRRSRLYVIVV